jgi:transposase-like protein
MRQYEQSGLTIRQFCEQEGLVAHQFSWWRAELKRRAAAAPPAAKPKKAPKKKARVTKTAELSEDSAPTFLPVQLKASLPAQATIEIVLEQPPRIRVTPGFDAQVLREVVRALEQC